MKKHLNVTLISLLSLVFSGCNLDANEMIERNVKSYSRVGSVEILYLEDGTKCAVFKSAAGSGISCDFEIKDNLEKQK